MGFATVSRIAVNSVIHFKMAHRERQDDVVQNDEGRRHPHQDGMRCGIARRIIDVDFIILWHMILSCLSLPCEISESTRDDCGDAVRKKSLKPVSSGQWAVVRNLRANSRTAFSFLCLYALASLMSPVSSRELCAADTAVDAKALTPRKPTVIVVVGAEGAVTYEKLFQEWADRWIVSAKQAGHEVIAIGRKASDSNEVDRTRFQSAIAAASTEKSAELWIVLIGHGTFDKREAKFNLRGPDVSAKELAQWLKPVSRPTAVVNCAAASAPFLSALAKPNRVVIAATKSGAEQNFTRFGDFISRAIADPQADLDKDEQTSLWEAYLAAARRTAEFYSTDGRLLTEHALLDDSGDGLGVRADQFLGLMPVEETKDGKPLDGQHAHQWHLVRNATDSALPSDLLKKRNELERAVLALRDRKSKLPGNEYLSELERLLVELAELNESAGK